MHTFSNDTPYFRPTSLIMLIGSGMLARAFSGAFLQREDVCIYAAGVSNSSCTDAHEFAREHHGFDVKAPFADYAETTGARASGARAQESLNYLLASGVAYEVRTTRHPALLSSGKLRSMSASLRRQGVETFALQEFRADGCSDARLDSRPPPLDDDAVSHLKQLFPTFILRRAS